MSAIAATNSLVTKGLLDLAVAVRFDHAFLQGNPRRLKPRITLFDRPGIVDETDRQRPVT